MITNSLLLFGPGGIGKSPVDSIVRQDALRIDPYRLRPTGPCDAKDVYYAHPKLRSELSPPSSILATSATVSLEILRSSGFQNARQPL